jgi:hypothetical protein
MTPSAWDDEALAAARMRSLARVVRAVGHDARGALGTVTLHGTLLAKALEADMPPAADRTRRWAAGMGDGSARLERLLDAVFGHLAPPRGSDATLAPVVANLVTLVRPYAFTRRVEVTMRDGVVQGPPVPEVARQVLLDGFLAAIDAAGEGGAVAVATATQGPAGSVTITGPTAAPALEQALAAFLPAFAALGGAVRVEPGDAFALTVHIPKNETKETGT